MTKFKMKTSIGNELNKMKEQDSWYEIKTTVSLFCRNLITDLTVNVSNFDILYHRLSVLWVPFTP